MDRRLPVGLKPKKRFGQNFLVDEKVVADLVAAANLTKEDVVIEIGAGTGVVTKELAKCAGQVLAFELDRDLIPALEKNLSGFDNIEIINDDLLRIKNSDDCILLCSSILSSRFKIVGSIPYQITSPLVHKLLTFEPRPSLVVLLIQKEVAEKITARPPKATYLSNICKLLGNVEIVRFVPKAAFWPAPKVDGAIIKLKVRSAKLKVDVGDFQKFLHRGFRNPRKMLRTKFDSADLESCGIDSTRRSQTLDFEEWVKVFNYLNDRTQAK